MKHTISPDRQKLTIKISDDEQRILYELGDDIHQDLTMTDFLEPLTRKELEWINPMNTGDLTSAPMLGILGDEMTIEEIEVAANSKPGIFGSVIFGHSGGKDLHQPILERWAFADYQVRSVLQNLRDYGRVVFVDRF